MGERKEFDVAQHLRELRAEVERQPATSNPFGGSTQQSRPPAAAKPCASANTRTTRYREFSALQGRAFVAQAYQGLLHRAADPEGMRVFHSQLVNGRRKAAILGAVRYSTEGRARGERVAGLFPRAALALAAELPIAGAIVDWIIALATLPRLAANLRRSEAAAAEIAEQVNHLRGRQDSLEADQKWSRTALRELSAAMHVAIASLDQSLATERADRLRDVREQEAGVARLSQRLREQEEAVAPLEQRLGEQEAAIARTREQWQRIDAIMDQERALTPIPMDRFGAEFVDAFRGSREAIITRQHIYLPVLTRLGSEAKTLPILDLGSGRGEWLELLQAKGFSARGVDDNLALVQACREAGFETVHGDLAQELANCADESLGAVTAFHVVEHLSFARLLGLLIDAFRALRPGGMLIMETPNPDNLLVASRNFYLDPTHRRPLPQELLMFMTRFAGFHDAEFLPLNPVTQDAPADRLQGLMDSAQDYAVVARKPDRAS